uniref:BED-type domain-containing protein n=1 Tax=Eptatretus burgeri TaxID=7764 RepID=A0A8C4QTN3_EPTBU
MGRYSQIWHYFGVCEEQPTRAVCNFCGVKVSRGGRKVSDFTTTNLIRHLLQHHKAAYEEYRQRQHGHKLQRESQATLYEQLYSDTRLTYNQSYLPLEPWEYGMLSSNCDVGESSTEICNDQPASDGVSGSSNQDAGPTNLSMVAFESGPHHLSLATATGCGITGRTQLTSPSDEKAAKPTLKRSYSEVSQEYLGEEDEDDEVEGEPGHDDTAVVVTAALPSWLIDRKVIEMLALDWRPLTAVADVGFRRLLSQLQRGYRPCGEAHFRERVLPEVCIGLRRKLQSSLRNAAIVCLTGAVQPLTPCGSGLIMLFGHWLDSHSRRCHGLLRVLPSTARPATLAKQLQRLVIEWGLEAPFTARPGPLLARGIPNLEEAAKMAGLPSAACFLQALTTMIYEGALQRATVHHLWETIGVSLEGFSSPSMLNRDLKHWHGLVKALHEARRNAESGFEEPDTDCTKLLKPAHLTLIDELIDVLESAEMIALELGKPDATLGSTLPLMRVFRRFLETSTDERNNDMNSANELYDITGVRRNMLVLIDNWLAEAENRRDTVLATVVDPRFKATFFSSDEVAQKACRWLAEEAAVAVAQGAATLSTGDSVGSVERHDAADNIEEEFGEDSNEENGKEGAEGHDGLWSRTQERDSAGGSPKFWHLFDTIGKELQRSPGARLALSPQEEAHLYLLEPLLNRCRSPFAWWHHSGRRFPQLRALAQRLLTAPACCPQPDGRIACSAAVGDADTASALLFIRHNLPNVNFDY